MTRSGPCALNSLVASSSISCVKAMCRGKGDILSLLPFLARAKIFEKENTSPHASVFTYSPFCGVQVTSMFPGAYSVVFVPS